MNPTFTSRGIVLLCFVVLFAVLTPYIVTNLWENLDAHDVMVIQSISGDLQVYTDPGPKWQGFGKVTLYPRRATYAFEDKSPMKGPDNSKKLRFNDGGHGNLSGSVSWEMPLEPKSIIAAHKTFGSAEGIETAAVAKMLDAAIYLAGPMMSSTESSGERRAELVQLINDQAENGVYVTHVVKREITDPLTGGKREVDATEIVRDEKGMPRRQQGSMLSEFNIRLFPLSISALTYDKVVEDQIAERQKATTQVQISQANANRAAQDAITTEKQGQANAAKAKWEQETIKAKFVTEAQQKLEVATLGAKEAEQYKREQILRGEGDAQRKQLVMSADGALDQKLEAYKQVNAAYADAIKAAQPGAWTPAVVMAGGSGSAGGAAGAAGLIDLFTAKAARDLGVDLGVSGRAATAKK